MRQETRRSGANGPDSTVLARNDAGASALIGSCHDRKASKGALDRSVGPFWKKPVADLTRKEWEALCDGCGRCCLVKLEDEDTGKIHFTDVACVLLESGSCRCRDYARRRRKVADCVKLTPENLETIPWLPPTCAYRLRREGKDLPDWHPLVSGDPETVHAAAVSARGRVSAYEDDVPLDELPRFIVSWPGRWPKNAQRPGRMKAK
jgi:uncharacterized protein